MKRTEIKKAIEKLVPDKEMEQRLSEQISQKRYNRFSYRSMASIAASVVIVASLGMFGHNLIEKKITTPPNIISQGDGIYIPKMELPKKTNAMANMIGLIVYQGRIYTQSDTRISPENAGKLVGEKLGTTKGNLDEWSKQEDYAVEFASSIGKSEVYSVKGYDKSFRIMTYGKREGNIHAEFFECFNGVTIRTGADVFDKLKIENNVAYAKQEKFASWNYNKQQYREIKDLQSLDSFIMELKNTTPYTQESLSYLFNNQGDTNQKFVYITLKDSSEVQLRLFKEGYVFYGSFHIFFKIEGKVFDKLWDELE